jgi:RNA polymerase sigma factor (sigma-70 family)
VELPLVQPIGTRPAAGTDDLVQETITKVFVHWARIRAVDDMDAYVRRVLLRTFLAEVRRPWARVGRYETPPAVPAADGSDADLRLVLRAALAQVPPRQRAVLVLRFLYDLPVQEVAKLLNCTTGTVKSQTVHGLNTMRRLLGRAQFAWTDRT